VLVELTRDCGDYVVIQKLRDGVDKASIRVLLAEMQQEPNTDKTTSTLACGLGTGRAQSIAQALYTFLINFPLALLEHQSILKCPRGHDKTIIDKEHRYLSVEPGVDLLANWEEIIAPRQSRSGLVDCDSCGGEKHDTSE